MRQAARPWLWMEVEYPKCQMELLILMPTIPFIDAAPSLVSFGKSTLEKSEERRAAPNLHFLNIPYIYGRTDTYLTSHDLPFDLPSPSNYLMIFHLPPKTIYSYWMERLWRMDGIGPIWPIRILGHCKRFRVYGCNHSYGEIQKYGLFCISGPRPRIQDPQKIAVIFIHCLGYKEVNCRGVPQPVGKKGSASDGG